MLKKMKKATIVGLAEKAPEIIEALQELGVVDIIQLNDDYDSGQIDKLQSEKNSIMNTLKLLAAEKTPVTTVSGEATPAEVIQRTVKIRARLDEIQEDRRRRFRQIEIWSFFGDFDPARVMALQEQGVHVQFFRASESQFFPESDTFAQHDVIVISRSAQKVFFCTIGVTPLSSPLFEEIPLPDLGLTDLEKQIDELAAEEKELNHELRELSAQKQVLANAWIDVENHYNFQRAIAQQVINGELFYVQGWVPDGSVSALKQLSDENGFILLLAEPAPKENPPTAHKNSTVGEIGESLIYIYDTPSYYDIEPSSMVFIFFSIFFGMIISDAGYGALLLLLSLGLIRGKSKGLKLFRTLSITISCSTILFGILTASYFAISINPESFIGKIVYTLAPLYRNTSEKEGLMSSMFISLWIGVINLSFVNIYKAYHERRISSIGWVPALIGLIPLFKLLFGVEWQGWEKTVQLWPLYGGVLFVAIFTAIETKTSLGGRMGAFGNAIYTVVQLVADLLSFLRIFALAMAGAKMAETFNMLFKMIYDGGGIIVGFTLGVFVLIIGHVINLVLNIMGGVIHGLRLNFIESYHWCLDGGGKKYDPLRKLK